MGAAASIWTIGHSTRPLEEFLALLAEHDLTALVDVRAFPGSRRHPHFGAGALEQALKERGLRYLHLPALGGRRQGAADSPNDGWRNASFRAYADHMASDEFAGGLTELMKLAGDHRTAVMCSEAVPWRCHRWLLSDALVVRGRVVEHIIGPGQTRTHTVTAFAQVAGTRIIYPAGGAAQGSLFASARPEV